MTNHRQPVRDEEECRLMDIAETCRSDESAAASALSRPSHSLLYPEYTRLLGIFRTTQLKGRQSRIALRTYQYNMRLELHNLN